jgi:hypothetical protein
LKTAVLDLYLDHDLYTKMSANAMRASEGVDTVAAAAMLRDAAFKLRKLGKRSRANFGRVALS